MTIAEMLAQLGSQIGLALKLDHQGTCRLIFDGEISVDIEAVAGVADQAYLHTMVGVVPAGVGEEFYELLLSANLFGRGTGGAILSVDPQRREVILHRTLQLGSMSYPDVTAAMEAFITQTRAWTHQLRSGSTRATKGLTAPDATFLKI